MKFAMDGNTIKNILGDDGSKCYICDDNEEKLFTCKACNLTICENCMSNEDLCENCMCELVDEGEFTTYVDEDFLIEMKDKYLKGNL